jgi:hypothetical protein
MRVCLIVGYLFKKYDDIIIDRDSFLKGKAIKPRKLEESPAKVDRGTFGEKEEVII